MFPRGYKPEWAADDFTQPAFRGRTVRYCMIDLLVGIDRLLDGWSEVLEEGFFEPTHQMMGGPRERVDR